MIERPDIAAGVLVEEASDVALDILGIADRPRESDQDPHESLDSMGPPHCDLQVAMVPQGDDERLDRLLDGLLELREAVAERRRVLEVQGPFGSLPILQGLA